MTCTILRLVNVTDSDLMEIFELVVTINHYSVYVALYAPLILVMPFILLQDLIKRVFLLHVFTFLFSVLFTYCQIIIQNFRKFKGKFHFINPCVKKIIYLILKTKYVWYSIIDIFHLYFKTLKLLKIFKYLQLWFLLHLKSKISNVKVSLNFFFKRLICDHAN